MQELAGRVALVTGSSRNLGRSIALELAAAGAAVVVNARISRAEAEAVATEIRGSRGKALAAIADVGDPAAVAAMIDSAISSFGRLDIVVNNAAIRDEKPFDALSLEDWHQTLAVILDGAFLCTQAALPHLRASGAGAIVNVGGMTAHTGAQHRAHVIAAKAGLVGLTRALAHELAGEAITVNCVAPGMLDTARRGSSPKHREGRTIPLGRLGAPHEVASAVRWLAGPNARFVTGQTIHVNGGTYMG